MIDHVSLQVTDVGRSRMFYEALLAPLGYRAAFADGEAAGFADSAGASFWLGPAERDEQRELHIAFLATDRSTVRHFHLAALSLGAEVLHAPRLFPQYDPHYFGCFVRDLDGHNIEAVCRQPEDARPAT
jgi:catechol 2,3-dioxygenase-like lactoylglutathione lyase family enzyme